MRVQNPLFLFAAVEIGSSSFIEGTSICSLKIYMEFYLEEELANREDDSVRLNDRPRPNMIFTFKI